MPNPLISKSSNTFVYTLYDDGIVRYTLNGIKYGEIQLVDAGAVTQMDVYEDTDPNTRILSDLSLVVLASSKIYVYLIHQVGVHVYTADSEPYTTFLIRHNLLFAGTVFGDVDVFNLEWKSRMQCIRFNVHTRTVTAILVADDTIVTGFNDGSVFATPMQRANQGGLVFKTEHAILQLARLQGLVFVVTKKNWIALNSLDSEINEQTLKQAYFFSNRVDHELWDFHQLVVGDKHIVFTSNSKNRCSLTSVDIVSFILNKQYPKQVTVTFSNTSTAKKLIACYELDYFICLLENNEAFVLYWPDVDKEPVCVRKFRAIDIDLRNKQFSKAGVITERGESLNIENV